MQIELRDDSQRVGLASGPVQVFEFGGVALAGYPPGLVISSVGWLGSQHGTWNPCASP